MGPFVRAHVLPMLLALLALPFVAGVATSAEVESSQHHRFRVVTLAEELRNPWGLAFLPDGGWLVTERSGFLRRIAPDGSKSRVDGLPEIVPRGQGGLLDVVLDPGFAENRLVYIAYVAGDGAVSTEVGRGRLKGNRLEDFEVILVSEPKLRGGQHFGARLRFAPDGMLLVTLGDRYSQLEQAQDLGDHIGTILRLNPDGSIPGDNPFLDTAGARPEIFTYGHRNVQGLAIHPETGEIWIHEHGPRGGDEVNVLRPGANYGWPEITYGIDYSGRIISEYREKPGMEQPVIYWDPSIAPSGMDFYDGEAFPAWHGDLFVGALKLRHLRRLEMEGDRIVAQEALLTGLNERIRDVHAGPDGFIYVLTDSYDGRLLRLEPVD